MLSDTRKLETLYFQSFKDYITCKSIIVIHVDTFFLITLVFAKYKIRKALKFLHLGLKQFLLLMIPYKGLY